MAEHAVKLKEENATLLKTAASSETVQRRTEGILKVLRDVLSESWKETEAALKERDAALLENQNLKRISLSYCTSGMIAGTVTHSTEDCTTVQ